MPSVHLICEHCRYLILWQIDEIGTVAAIEFDPIAHHIPGHHLHQNADLDH